MKDLLALLLERMSLNPTARGITGFEWHREQSNQSQTKGTDEEKKVA